MTPLQEANRKRVVAKLTAAFVVLSAGSLVLYLMLR